MFSYNYSIARKIWNGTLDMSSPVMQILGSPLGYTQYRNTLDSTKAQIDYNDYISRGNARALADWKKNVGSKGRTIRYPELSYPGRIYQATTGSTRAMYDADNAFSNFVGNVGYRTAGLYGIGSRVSRWL